MPSTRARLIDSTRLDSKGAGEAVVSARGLLAVWHVRVEVDPLPGKVAPLSRSAALLYLDGVALEGTAAGSGDSSDTQYELQPGEELRCRWTGGDPDATGRLIVRGYYQ